MEIPQSSSTREMSVLADLLPRASTATVSSNFGLQQLPFGVSQFSQAMVQPTISTSLSPYSSKFPNKHSMKVAIPPEKDHFSMPVYFGLHQFEQTSKFKSGIDPSPKVPNQAFVNAGTTFTLTSSKHQAHQFVGSHQFPSKSPAQAELAVKVQADFASVRSKLRESLASALATGSKEISKPKSPEKVTGNEEKNLSSQATVPSLKNEIHPSPTDDSICENSPNHLNANNQVKNFDGNQESPDEVSSSGNMCDQKEDIICDVQHDQQNPNIVLDEGLFSHSIMEDELLRGHGLCWASDLTSVNGESELHSMPKRPKLAHEEENKDTTDAILQTSENLASRIETELFKLYGGVNKKYKEKGRSLLFNLKDPSNPELRERVLSGDVLPERLCSMSAEELASKELSQWRQAKAEEYAQMVMLPDMDIDIRRLVKKTHKGEFQVEVDQDDVVHAEVGLVSDVLSKVLTKENEVDQGRSTETGLTSSKTHDSEISDELVPGEKSGLDDRIFSSDLDPRFPEKTDYTQEYIVEEMKETELPPVVSLDEFMQDLDSEPPFENLEVDSLQENTSSNDRKLDKSGSENILESDVHGLKVDFTSDISTSNLAMVNILDSQLHSSNINDKNNKEISPISSQVAYKYQNNADTMKMESDCDKHVIRMADSTPNRSIVWEGFLQLNISALSNVVSSFLSGEKTSMQGWPNIFEVKGRVRLDAFEKFLQELPLSRSRAIMLVEFSWKENSMESGQLHLSEAIHSYIIDDRVGFAEPAPGVELYLCPPHPKITSMLEKHLPGDLEKARGVIDGLLGIVVWRRPHVLVSPRVSSHHKHSSAKRLSGSKRHQESKSSSSLNQSPAVPRGNPVPQQTDDIDDVPPGFGPLSVREADDLPEFDFSRSGRFVSAAASVPATACPSSHVRELIQKYGQGGSSVRELGIPVQPWNDEDDIPEWNPNQIARQTHQTHPLPMPLQGYQQPQGYQQLQLQQQHNPHSFMMSHQPMPPSPHPLGPQNVIQQPNAPWWPASAQGMPDGSGLIRPCFFGGQPSGGVRPPAIGPRMVQGFGRGNNGMTSWRPEYGGRGF